MESSTSFMCTGQEISQGLRKYERKSSHIAKYIRTVSTEEESVENLVFSIFFNISFQCICSLDPIPA